MQDTYDGIDERLDVSLVRAQSEPHRAHHDRESHVHGDSDPVSCQITVPFDGRAMQESEDLAHGGRLLSGGRTQWLIFTQSCGALHIAL